MKTASAILLVILAILASGCTAAAPAAPSPAATAGAPAAAAAVPDLAGNWTGPMQGYDQGTGFSDYRNFSVVMDVTGQHGRIFAGTITFTANGTASSSGFAGAIGRDGKTLTITEEAGGYCTGSVVGENEIELVYMQDGSPYSIAIDSFRRE